MKISLLQSQLAINAFMITMIEKDIKDYKQILKDANIAIEKFIKVGHKYYGEILQERESAIHSIKYGKKKLAKLVELQKSLKKQVAVLLQRHRQARGYAKQLTLCQFYEADDIEDRLDKTMGEIILLERY